MIFAYGSNNVSYVVTDPAGKRTGFDPSTNTTYNENPDSRYYVESVSTAPTEGTVQTLVQGYNFENTSSVLEGKYQIDVHGITDGLITLQLSLMIKTEIEITKQIIQD